VRRVAVPLRPVAVAKPAPTAATYKRRQLVAFAIAVLLAIVALSAARAAIGGPGAEPLTGPRSAGGTTGLQPIARTVYVVQPGDTLWEIARALQPEGDVRPLVGRIADQRGGAPLQVGERIALP
jgi:nucleoid-associated protein YgaU